MAELFDFTIKNGAAGGFGMFSAAHFAWLAVLLAAGAACVWRIKMRMKIHGASSAAGMGRVGDKLLRAALLLAAGEYNIGRLPLHLCAMAVYICALPRVARRRADGGSSCTRSVCLAQFFALIFPDWGYYPALHFMSVSSFVIHGMIVTYVVMQVAARDIVPDVKKCPQSLVLMLALALPVYIFDRATGTITCFSTGRRPARRWSGLHFWESRLRAGLSADPRRRLGGDVLSVPPDGENKKQ